jgi:acyl carrier protein
MTYEQWNIPIKGRVQGTRNLHSILPKELDFFVLLSSVCGIFGNPSQANYAASSTYLDAFANCFSSSSAPIVSLDLGYMQFSGTLAESQALSKRMQNLSYLTPILEPQLMGLLDFHCNTRRSAKHGCQTVIGVTYPRNAQQSSTSSALNRPLWRALRLTNGDVPNSGSLGQKDEYKKVRLSSMLASASSSSEQTAMVVEAFLHKLSSELGVDEEAVDMDKTTYDIGVDSLMAVQLRSWFRKEINANISVFDIMGNVSARELCGQAMEKSPLLIGTDSRG